MSDGMRTTPHGSLCAFRFHVIYVDGNDELIEVEAHDSHEAVSQLPNGLRSWNFAMWPDGYYRKKVA